jgi:hypothetical protein
LSKIKYEKQGRVVLLRASVFSGMALGGHKSIHGIDKEIFVLLDKMCCPQINGEGLWVPFFLSVFSKQ